MQAVTPGALRPRCAAESFVWEMCCWWVAAPSGTTGCPHAAHTEARDLAFHGAVGFFFQVFENSLHFGFFPYDFRMNESQGKQLRTQC